MAVWRSQGEKDRFYTIVIVLGLALLAKLF